MSIFTLRPLTPAHRSTDTASRAERVPSGGMGPIRAGGGCGFNHSSGAKFLANGKRGCHSPFPAPGHVPSQVGAGAPPPVRPAPRIGPPAVPPCSGDAEPSPVLPRGASSAPPPRSTAGTASASTARFMPPAAAPMWVPGTQTRTTAPRGPCPRPRPLPRPTCPTPPPLPRRACKSTGTANTGCCGAGWPLGRCADGCSSGGSGAVRRAPRGSRRRSASGRSAAAVRRQASRGDSGPSGPEPGGRV